MTSLYPCRNKHKAQLWFMHFFLNQPLSCTCPLERSSARSLSRPCCVFNLYSVSAGSLCNCSMVEIHLGQQCKPLNPFHRDVPFPFWSDLTSIFNARNRFTLASRAYLPLNLASCDAPSIIPPDRNPSEYMHPRKRSEYAYTHYTNAVNDWLPIAHTGDGQEQRIDWGRRDLIYTALQVSALFRIRIHLEFTLHIICLSSPWSLTAAFAWILVKTMLGEDTLPC